VLIAQRVSLVNLANYREKALLPNLMLQQPLTILRECRPIKVRLGHVHAEKAALRRWQSSCSLYARSLRMDYNLINNGAFSRPRTRATSIRDGSTVASLCI